LKFYKLTEFTDGYIVFTKRQPAKIQGSGSFC